MLNPADVDPLALPAWLWEVMAYQVNYYRRLGDPFMYESLPPYWHWGQQNAELSDASAPWN